MQAMRPRRLRATHLLLAALLAVGGARAAAGDQLETYRPQHRSAAELAPVVSEILGPGGMAVAAPGGGALLMRGDPASIEQALQLLPEIDVPIPVYRVESTLTTLRELRRVGVRVDGWVTAGEIRVGKVRLAEEGLRVRVRSALSEGEERFQAFVTVLDGRRAEIWTGTTYPERVQSLHEEAGRLRVYETTTLVPVQTGFAVLPRGLADGRIDLELAPISAEEAPEGRVVRAGMATRVILHPEELVVVAGIREVGRELRIDPFATLDHREGARETVLVVRVDPLPEVTTSPPGGSGPPP
jgi:hypothetical protein